MRWKTVGCLRANWSGAYEGRPPGSTRVVKLITLSCTHLSLALPASEAANHVFHFDVSHALPDLMFWRLQERKKKRRNVWASNSCLNSSPKANAIFITICSLCAFQMSARFPHLLFLYWQMCDLNWSGRRGPFLKPLTCAIAFGSTYTVHEGWRCVCSVYVHRTKDRLRSGVAPHVSANTRTCRN